MFNEQRKQQICNILLFSYLEIKTGGLI